MNGVSRISRAIWLAMLSANTLFGQKLISSAESRLVSADTSYGYTPSNPVRLGGFPKSIVFNDLALYFESLASPDGKPVSFKHIGYCCPFELEFQNPVTQDSGGILEKYEVTYEGLQKSTIVYVDFYNRGKLNAPHGLRFKIESSCEQCDEEWDTTLTFDVVATEHFIIYYPSSWNKKAIDWLTHSVEDIHDHHSRLLNQKLMLRWGIVIFARIALPGCGLEVSGCTIAKKRRILIRAFSIGYDLQHDLGHEIVHAFDYEAIILQRINGKGEKQ